MARFRILFWLVAILTLALLITFAEKQPSPSAPPNCEQLTSGMQLVSEDQSFDFGFDADHDIVVFDLTKSTVVRINAQSVMDITPDEGNMSYFQELKLSISLNNGDISTEGYGVKIARCDGLFYVLREPLTAEVQTIVVPLPTLTPNTPNI